MTLLYALWLAAACLPVLDEPAAAERAARLAFARAYREFWQQEFGAWRSGVEPAGSLAERLLPGSLVARSAAESAPATVQESLAFYVEHVERADWGSVYLYRVRVAARGIWAVHVSTDGDDGWLEIYDEGGRLLGAARSYIELLAWGPRADMRALVFTGGYPAALADRAQRTLWQSP